MIRIQFLAFHLEDKVPLQPGVMINPQFISHTPDIKAVRLPRLAGQAHEGILFSFRVLFI